MEKSIKQALAWWCFAPRHLSSAELIGAARDIGFDGLEMVPPEHRRAVRDAGLEIATGVGHQSIAHGLNRRENHARIEQELLASMEEAVAWGIPSLICFSGERGGLDDQAGLEATVEGLQRLAGAAEAAGVTLVLELLNSKRDHPDYQCDRTDWGAEVCRRVNSPRIKLLYDIYHAQIMEGDIIATIQTHHAHFGHYHTAGCPGRHELDPGQELNYPAILAAIRHSGYTGWIGHEFIPTGDPLAGMRQAFGLLGQQ